MVERFCNCKGIFVHRNYSLWNRKLLNVAIVRMNNMFYLLICYSTESFIFFALKLLLVTFPKACCIRYAGSEQNMNTKDSDWTFTIRSKLDAKKRLQSVGSAIFSSIVTSHQIVILSDSEQHLWLPMSYGQFTNPYTRHLVRTTTRA
jgi:hypothetical protein